MAAIARPLRQRPDALRGEFLRHAIVQRLSGAAWSGANDGHSASAAAASVAVAAPCSQRRLPISCAEIVHVQPRGGALDAQAGGEPAAGSGMGRLPPISRGEGTAAAGGRRHRDTARAKARGHGAAGEAAAADPAAMAAKRVPWAVHARLIPSPDALNPTLMLSCRIRVNTP
jgi:hypothetical protein